MTQITKTFEPIRPIYAPDGGAAYMHQVILSRDVMVHYGESDWPSRSYMLILAEPFSL